MRKQGKFQKLVLQLSGHKQQVNKRGPVSHTVESEEQHQSEVTLWKIHTNDNNKKKCHVSIHLPILSHASLITCLLMNKYSGLHNSDIHSPHVMPVFCQLLTSLSLSRPPESIMFKA